MSQLPAHPSILGIAHLGIRVAELERSLAFYALLGFEHVAGPFEHEPVVILENAAGVEINLIVNAVPESNENVLMDVPQKYAGYTHAALVIEDVAQAVEVLRQHGIEPSGGTVDFPTGARGIFVRDPDRNVIELHQRAPTVLSS